jgi:hypothetical protein
MSYYWIGTARLSSGGQPNLPVAPAVLPPVVLVLCNRRAGLVAGLFQKAPAAETTGVTGATLAIAGLKCAPALLISATLPME